MGRQAGKTGLQASPAVSWMAWSTFFAVFLINVLGFTDTVTGSALGCGRDWPLCNGEWIPSTWTTATVIEYTHRLSVMFGGLLMLAWAVIAWRRYRVWWQVRVALTLMVGGVVVQAVLGALAVLFVNPNWVMALHMGMALLSLTGSYQMAVLTRRVERGLRAMTEGSFAQGATPFRIGPASVDPVFRRWARWAVPYVFIAIYVGAYVAYSGAGALFSGWPIPMEPASVGRAFWIDVLHRSVALGLVVWMAGLYWYSRRFVDCPGLRRASLAALWLVCLQAFSGAYLIASHLSVPAFLLHASIVSCLFCVICQLALDVSGEEVRTPSTSRPQLRVIS